MFHFFFLFAKQSLDAPVTLFRNKAISQSAASSSFQFLYDEKRDKKATENGSEILFVDDFLNLFLKFSYLVRKPSSEWKKLSSLWRWLPFRLSKRQSLTTVLLRTPIKSPRWSFSIQVCYSCVQTIFLFTDFIIQVRDSTWSSSKEQKKITFFLLES